MFDNKSKRKWWDIHPGDLALPSALLLILNGVCNSRWVSFVLILWITLYVIITYNFIIKRKKAAQKKVEDKAETASPDRDGRKEMK